MKKSKWSTQKLITTAMLAAVAGALMSMEFSLPLMPVFYKIDFSDVPSIIALFLMGPASAACVEIVKILIKLITVGTNTAFVGEIANLISIAFFVLPTWIVYKKRGQTGRAVAESLTVCVVFGIITSCFVNAFITLPLYAKAMGTDIDSVVQAVSAFNPAIKNLPTFIILATVPFNLIKKTLNCVVGYALYDRLVHVAAIRSIGEGNLRRTSANGAIND